ncbi:S15/NS1 RNA-binding domain-containing protein [Phlegmacium glaucopus]|nr:S15/NS1 RNA-binding domain-containing protein [Phlegmacium glaucopus]
MFRTCISTGSRAIASTSKYIHSSAVLCSQATKRTGARNKKINLLKTEQRLKVAAENRPSVVLGTRPKEEGEKWKNCDLAKVLVDEEELVSSTELEPKDFTIGKVNVPKQFGFGVDTSEQKMLLDSLPVLTADMAQQGRLDMAGYSDNQGRQLQKANMFAKVLDLRNANAAGIAYENRRRIIYAFSSPERPFDPGRTEVQAALLTYKIRKLWTHLTTFKRDVGNRRSLRLLVHERAKMLRYLRKTSRDRYETLLERLALEPESVEGELVV